MPISVTCSHCGKRLKARDELAGKALPCPSCKEKVLIPETEEDIAGYLLQDEPPPQEPSSISLPSSTEEQVDDEITVRRKPERTTTSPRKVASLPPLTANEPPLWLRHLHWLLVLALLPLAFSLLNTGEREDFKERILKTVEAAPLDVQHRLRRAVIETLPA